MLPCTRKSHLIEVQEKEGGSPFYLHFNRALASTESDGEFVRRVERGMVSELFQMANVHEKIHPIRSYPLTSIHGRSVCQHLALS